MKAIALSALILISSSAALAGITDFKCELKSERGQFFKFQIDNLGTANAEPVHADPEDGYSPIFSTDSQSGTISAMIGALDGQGGDLRVGETRIRFWGDSAGIDFTDLVLYKNSGFAKGFVRYDFAGEKGYSKVSCEVKAIK